METTAPEGKIFVCCACGKRAKDIYGGQSPNYGWDESCAMNAKMFDESQLVIGEDNLVKEIRNVESNS